MYCKFCGKTISEDSCFCAYCGKEVSPTTTPSQQTKVVDPQPLLPEKPASHFALWLFLLFVFLLIVAIVIAVSSNNGSSNGNSNNDIGILERALKSSDYTYTTSQGLTSYMITIVPTTDIKQCDIALSLYNSNGEKIFSDTLSKSNLKAGSSYTYTFDFGFVNSLSGDNVRYRITGKVSNL